MKATFRGSGLLDAEQVVDFRKDIADLNNKYGLKINSTIKGKDSYE